MLLKILFSLRNLLNFSKKIYRGLFFLVLLIAFSKISNLFQILIYCCRNTQCMPWNFFVIWIWNNLALKSVCENKRRTRSPQVKTLKSENYPQSSTINKCLRDQVSKFMNIILVFSNKYLYSKQNSLTKTFVKTSVCT